MINGAGFAKRSHDAIPIFSRPPILPTQPADSAAFRNIILLIISMISRFACQSARHASSLNFFPFDLLTLAALPRDAI